MAAASTTKVYLVVFLIRFMMSVMQVIQKAAFNDGMNTYVFSFYRQLFATAFLLPFAVVFERKTAPPLPFKIGFKMFIFALVGVTASLNLYHISVEYTSATLSGATLNSIPVITFIIAALLGMEAVKIKRLSGIAKVSGVVLCSAGIVVIAIYRGPELKSFNHHHTLNHGSSQAGDSYSSKRWMLGVLIMTISNVAWSLWLVLQGPLLKEYPSKLLFTTSQCLFSTIQSFFVALAAERDFTKWKLGFDMGLLSVAYSGIVGTGVTFYLQSWCIEQRGPVFLAMNYPLTFIMTMIGSSLFLGESISLGSALGGVLMVGGLYSVVWGKRKEKMDDNIPLSQNPNPNVNVERKEIVLSTQNNQSPIDANVERKEMVPSSRNNHRTISHQ